MTTESDKPGRSRPLTVAERKRRQRQRLQDAGLAPVELWIPPRHRPILRRIEQLLRRDILPLLPDLETASAIGEKAMDINVLRETLDNFTSENGFTFTTVAVEDGAAMQVVVEDRDEFPIIVSGDDEQTLCITYLWDEAQIKTDSRMALLSTLLEMNVPLPLSSFGKIGERYVLFGALAASSSTEDLITEIETLSDNTLEVIEAVTPFLN
jgi:uncharacterized protein